MGIARQREVIASAAAATADFGVTDAADYKRFEFVITTTGEWSCQIEGRDHDDDSWAPLTAAFAVDGATEYVAVVTALSQVQLAGTRVGGTLTASVTKTDAHPTRW